MAIKIDLHMHTCYSDGSFTPSQVVELAHKKGLDIIGITDHDSVNGIKEAISVGKDIGVEIIPGVEISTDIDDKEVHLLAYFIDIENEELQKYLSFFRDERCTGQKELFKNLKI